MVPIEQFCCQNSQYPPADGPGEGNLCFSGFSAKTRLIRMVYCRSCKVFFSERKGTFLEHSQLPWAKALISRSPAR